MHLSEIETAILDLNYKIEELRLEQNQNIGFIISHLSDEQLTTAIINNRLSESIHFYILKNYNDFSPNVVATLLKSEHFNTYNFIMNNAFYLPIFKENHYMEYLLANPNLTEFHKKQVKKQMKSDLANKSQAM